MPSLESWLALVNHLGATPVSSSPTGPREAELPVRGLGTSWGGDTELGGHGIPLLHSSHLMELQSSPVAQYSGSLLITQTSCIGTSHVQQDGCWEGGLSSESSLARELGPLLTPAQAGRPAPITQHRLFLVEISSAE